MTEHPGRSQHTNPSRPTHHTTTILTLIQPTTSESSPTTTAATQTLIPIPHTSPIKAGTVSIHIQQVGTHPVTTVIDTDTMVHRVSIITGTYTTITMTIGTITDMTMVLAVTCTSDRTGCHFGSDSNITHILALHGSV